MSKQQSNMQGQCVIVAGSDFISMPEGKVKEKAAKFSQAKAVVLQDVKLSKLTADCLKRWKDAFPVATTVTLGIDLLGCQVGDELVALAAAFPQVACLKINFWCPMVTFKTAGLRGAVVSVKKVVEMIQALKQLTHLDLEFDALDFAGADAVECQSLTQLILRARRVYWNEVDPKRPAGLQALLFSIFPSLKSCGFDKASGLGAIEFPLPQQVMSQVPGALLSGGGNGSADSDDEYDHAPASAER